MKHILLLFVIFTYGCGVIPILDTPEIEDPAPVIEEVIDVNNETKDVIDKHTDETIKIADDIKDDTQDIIDKVPDDIKDTVQPNVDSIGDKADRIKVLQELIQAQAEKMDEANDKLKATLIDVKTATQQNDQLRAEKGQLLEDNAKLTAENEDLENAKQQALFGKMVYLIIASVILGAICLVSAFKGEPKAIWGAVGAGIVIIVSLAISFYMIEFALFGFIAIVGGIILLGWNAYSDYVNKKATKELVHTVEATKDKLPVNANEEIFGKHATVGQAQMIQSPSTVKLVQKIRKEKRDDWEPIIKKAS
jgi:ABC-type multidrug transport system fused ATPase/permease subunit